MYNIVQSDLYWSRACMCGTCTEKQKPCKEISQIYRLLLTHDIGCDTCENNRPHQRSGASASAPPLVVMTPAGHPAYGRIQLLIQLHEVQCNCLDSILFVLQIMKWLQNIPQEYLFQCPNNYTRNFSDESLPFICDHMQPTARPATNQ